MADREFQVGDKVKISNGGDKGIGIGTITEIINSGCCKVNYSGYPISQMTHGLELVEAKAVEDMKPAFEGAIVGFNDNPKEYRHGCGVRYDLLVPEFIEGMAQVMHKGASKYGEGNWKKGLSGENSGLNHAMKHIGEYQMGKPCDFGVNPEDHMFQVAVNCMFEWYLMRQKRLDSKGK